MANLGVSKKECILKVQLSVILKLFCMFSHMTLEDTVIQSHNHN